MPGVRIGEPPFIDARQKLKCDIAILMEELAISSLFPISSSNTSNVQTPDRVNENPLGRSRVLDGGRAEPVQAMPSDRAATGPLSTALACA